MRAVAAALHWLAKLCIGVCDMIGRRDRWSHTRMGAESMLAMCGACSVLAGFEHGITLTNDLDT